MRKAQLAWVQDGEMMSKPPTKCNSTEQCSSAVLNLTLWELCRCPRKKVQKILVLNSFSLGADTGVGLFAPLSSSADLTLLRNYLSVIIINGGN